MSTFNELLEKDNSVYTHYRNIHALAIEIFKVANGMSPVIMMSPIHSVYHSSEFASYLGLKIWELIPPVIRQIESMDLRKK